MEGSSWSFSVEKEIAEINRRFGMSTGQAYREKKNLSDCPEKKQDNDDPGEGRETVTFSVRITLKLKRHLDKVAKREDRKLNYVIVRDICKAEGLNFDEYK